MGVKIKTKISLKFKLNLINICLGSKARPIFFFNNKKYFPEWLNMNWVKK